MEGNPVLAHPGGVTPSLGKPVPDVPGSKEPKALVTEGWEEPGQGPRERLTGPLSMETAGHCLSFAQILSP